MNKLRIAVTGATGLLGRNLLFEFIKQNFNYLDTLEIFILGRSKDNLDIKQRIKHIILNDGVKYLALFKNEDIENLREYCDARIKFIDVDLDKEKLDMAPEDLKKLKSNLIDFFFHIAALTDFRNTPSVIDALVRTNVSGTKQILQLSSALQVRQFCYISSAYTCGDTFGDIKPDYINISQSFRNPYEKSKLEAEILVRNFSKKTGIRCRYFRPSTICGRLIEPPLGAINKFDVFYAWCAFFLRLKLKKLKNWEEKYHSHIDLNMRLRYGLKKGINIVPADYAAKVIYQVCSEDASGESFHLVNNQETPHNYHLPYMLKAINIGGIKQIDSLPDSMNSLEQLYYRTVGSIFTPYMMAEPMLFDVKNIETVLHKANISCPPVDENNFPILIKYAKKYNFGLDIEKIV